MSTTKTPIRTLNGHKLVDVDARLDIEKLSKEIEQIPADIAQLTSGITQEGLPLVYIDGDIPTDKTSVQAKLTVVSDWLNLSAYIKIKCQGNSSMAYDKKNFTVTLYSDEARSTPLNITIPGWGHASNKYVLKANYIDRTHARNVINARLWGEVVASRADYASLPAELRKSPNNGAVDGFPILVTTNGTYQGIYTWNIGKDAWMWGMDESNSSHVLMCGETNTDGTYTETPCNFRALWSGTDGQDWSVEVGANSEALKTSLNALISYVKDTTDEEFVAQADTYLDIQSAIDYYIFAYVNCGIDSLAKNMLLATYDMQVWHCGAYDLDTTWGLYWYGYDTVPATRACPSQYQEQYSLLWTRISTLFSDRFKERYQELRASVLSYANIVSHFERFTAQIGEKAYADDVIAYTDIPSKDTNNIWQLRNYVRDRLVYCDEKILNDQPVLFELGATKTFAGTDFIDSGVKLYDTDKDFTIAVEFTPAEENPTLCKLLFCGYDNYELAGATYRPLAMTRTINGSDKYYIVSAYGVSVSCYINPDIAIQHRLVLTHTAGTNVLRGDYTDDAGAVKNFTITAPGWVSFDRTLLIGCHEWQDEKKGYYWMGTMTDCRILNYALKSSQVQGYLQAGRTALS